MRENKLINQIKKLFTINFIKFCIIGVINTVIHLLVYNTFKTFVIDNGTIANTLAFITASIFSYWANTKFTYKEHINKNTFILSMITFLIKLLMSNGLEWLFRYIFTSSSLEKLIPLIPIFITAILTPLQFFVFNKIFDGKDEEMMKKIKDNIYLLYSLVFVIFVFIGLLPIEIKNNTFFFSGLFVDRVNSIDGLKQHVLFMYDYIDKIKSAIFDGGGLSIFRYDIGLGADFLINYTYYSLFDPLTIIAYIIPLKYIEFSYYLLIFIRLYLSGIFVILLAKKLGIIKTEALLTTAVFYVFNMAVLFSAFRHPMFINGPMLLPLIILGVEKVYRKESPFLLIITTFVALISQFYFFIYLTFGFELYIIIRSFPNFKQKRFSEFIKLNFIYLLGTLLGGFVLIPQLIGTLSGSRLGIKGFVLYDNIDYATLIFSLFIPLSGDHYTASIGNLIVFFLCLLYIIREKKKTTMSIYFIILVLLSFSACFSYLINAKSYITNRWMFLLCLPAAIIVGKFINDKPQVEEKETRIVSKIIISLSILATALALGYVVSLLVIPKLLVLNIQILLALLGIFIIYKLKDSKLNVNKLVDKINHSRIYLGVISLSLLSFLIMSGIYCFILTPGYVFNEYYSDPHTYQLFKEDPDFFRVEQRTYVANVEDYSNDGIFYGYPSTSSYNTMSNGHIIDFIDRYNVNNTNNTVGYNGFNFRTRLLAINNVKYVIIRDSDQVLPPYGYSFYQKVLVEKYDDSKKMYKRGGVFATVDGEIQYEYANIYINDNYLKFGVIYDSYLTTEDLNDLNYVEREKLLLDTVVLENDIPELKKYDVTYQEKLVEVKDIVFENIRKNENNLIVVENNGKIKFVIDEVKSSEVYIEIHGLKNQDQFVTFNTKYQSKNSLWEERNYGRSSNLALPNPNHLINLGYYENETNLEVAINLTTGEYQLESIGYFLVSSNDIKAKVDNLNEHSLNNLELNNHGFSGTTTNNKAGLMYISLPYSKGFTAFVDDNEVPIYKTNTGYMSIFLPEGNHNIEFVYRTPGIWIGICFSLGALAIIILMFRKYLVNNYKNKHHNNSEDLNEENITVFR